MGNAVPHKIQHDQQSARAASAYWQSIILERAALLLLTLNVVAKMIYFGAFQLFDTRLTTISPVSETLFWWWLAGASFLALTVAYRLVARHRFKRSDALAGLNHRECIPVFTPRNPFHVWTRDGDLDWSLN